MSETRDVAVRCLFNADEATRSCDRLPGIAELDFSALGAVREPRDEAALLLAVGAEIEHALMVQYLYAGYSIRMDQASHEDRGRVEGLAAGLIQVAREEMGHFITVQNLLRLIGAPLHFERQDSPFESVLYPFRFKLERLSQGSLAKYVTAESPVMRPTDLSDEEWQALCRIAGEARAANDGQPVRHVGELYARLIVLFSDRENGLKDADFVLGQDVRQARYDDWGYDPDSSIAEERGTRRVQVDSFTAGTADAQRNRAVVALRELSEQGEGFGSGVDSHFERFWKLYDLFGELTEAGLDPVWPVATNPTVIEPQLPADWSACDMAAASRAAFASNGYITDARTRDWATLFNIRYRLLLAFLAHFLQSEDGLYSEEDGDRLGDPTARGLLLIWTFDEMRRVKKIAEKLVQLPLRDPDDGTRSGGPFELPYTITLSDDAMHRWRGHLDVVRSAIRLIGGMRERGEETDREDPFLRDVYHADIQRERVLVELAANQPVPDEAFPRDFSKVAHILEQAVRGFSINVHGNFWSDRTRDEFVGQHIFNRPLFGRDPAEECRLDSTRSFLLRTIQPQPGRMPRYRPVIPNARRKYIENWIDRQAPDSEPRGKLGIVTEAKPSPEPAAVFVQAKAIADRQADLSYAADIRPMFREFDKVFMKRLDGIDIDDVKSVRRRAKHIAKNLKRGRLPYDCNWPREHIDRFDRWRKKGMNE